MGGRGPRACEDRDVGFIGGALSVHLDATWRPVSRKHSMHVCIFYMNKDIAAFVHFPRDTYRQETNAPLRHNRQSSFEQPRFRAVAARRLARFARPSHVVTSNNKEWRTTLLSARISRLLPDNVGDDLLPTPTPTLFFVKRTARSTARADLRNAKLCGLYSHGRVITFLVTSLSHPALFRRSPSFLFVSPSPRRPPSFRSRARVTIPREPVIFTPKWPVSSNWTTIIRTIATRIIATVMRRITAPEVISPIVKDCPCPCLQRGRW